MLPVLLLAAALLAAPAGDGGALAPVSCTHSVLHLQSPVLPPAVLPPRPPDAPGGAELLRSLEGRPLAGREEAIVQQILSGNVPSTMRCWRAIRLEARCPDGRLHTAEVSVLPDLLSVGGEGDSVRVCLTPQSAQRVADALGCLLPTVRLSDEIHRQADLKVPPDPLTHERESIATMIRHSRILDARIGRAAPGTLVAGGKKDIVITDRLLERPGRVAIYGWHHPDGRPIQPLTTVHTDRYVDYSHGIRLVRRAMKVDGRDADLAQVLTDASLAALVSSEGPMKAIRY